LPKVTDTSGARASIIPRSVRRLWILRIGSVLLGLLVAGLGVEIALRILDVRPGELIGKRILLRRDDPTALTFACYPENLHGELSPLPDTRTGAWQVVTTTLPPREVPLERLGETPWCVEYLISPQGLRDRTYDQVPPPGVLRIAMLGDSFVLGEGVPLERTLPKQTEKLLGSGYEVMNVGTSGLNTEQELAAFEQRVPSLGAERSILVFVPNDIDGTPELDQREAMTMDQMSARELHVLLYGQEPWYAGSSRLVEFLGSQWATRRITRETIRWYQDLYDPRFNQANLMKLGSDFRHFAAAGKNRVVVVLYPLMEGFAGEYPLAAAHTRVAGMARGAGLPVLDLAPVFVGHETSELWVHPADHHPNGGAHELAARAIVEWLRKEHPEFLTRSSGDPVVPVSP